MDESAGSDGEPVADTETTSAPNACPNCGALKQGRFCAVCGQNDRDYLRSLFPVLYQVLAETFEADSRVWRTLGALFLHPGLLSLEFSRNRRARYLSPFRLYLFTSLLFFLVLSLTVDDREPGDGPPLIQVGASEDGKDGKDDEDDEDDAVANLDFGDAAANSEAIEVLKRSLGEERARKIDEILARPESTVSRMLLAVNAEGLAGGDEGLDQPIDLFVAGQLVDVFHAPTTVVRDRFVGYLPVAMFFVLPIYALMLKVLFIRRHRFYAEHLVFSMHIHTIAFVVFSVALLTPPPWPWVDQILLLALTGYYFMALKRFYATGVFGTVAGFLFLTWLYSMLLAAMLLGALAAVVVLF
ncbi:MAG: DUF3667 domain-containing protein [Gammaproteobacteria bacterium]|nr:DUF3667 domain-containing protein [Gammaproteobacteria bacterium]MYK47879.1 DUF3667 domain-containing protein [Gammaproteobacteria bacterium]